MNADPPFLKDVPSGSGMDVANFVLEFIKMQAFFNSKALKTLFGYRNLSIFYHSGCNQLITKNLIFYIKVKLFLVAFSSGAPLQMRLLAVSGKGRPWLAIYGYLIENYLLVVRSGFQILHINSGRLPCARTATKLQLKIWGNYGCKSY